MKFYSDASIDNLQSTKNESKKHEYNIMLFSAIKQEIYLVKLAIKQVVDLFALPHKLLSKAVGCVPLH